MTTFHIFESMNTGLIWIPKTRK